MVTVETSWSYMQTLLEKKISLDEFKKVLFQLGFELDDINDDIIKVDITAERLDALSAQGLARCINSLVTKKTPSYIPKKSNYEVIVDKSVTSVRPYTVCCVIKNISFTEESLTEIIRIQEKLHATFGKHRKKAAIGIYPNEKISWPIRYMAKKPQDISFIPLQSTQVMTADEILVSHPTGKEYAHLLEGHTTYPIFVDAQDMILSMPPIINSEQTGRVTTQTNEVFIECSGHDYKTLEALLHMLASVCVDMGGELYSVKVNEINTPSFETKKLQFKTEKIGSLLGLKLSDSQIIDALQRMQYNATISKNMVTVVVPAYRTDIWHEVDIIDDIMRACDVNTIQPIVPSVPTQGHMLDTNKYYRSVRDFLVGHGLQEVRTFGTTDAQIQFGAMNIEPIDHITLGSAAEKSINMLRVWLTPELLKLLSNNQNMPHPHRLFEIGDVIIPDDTVDVKSKNVTKLSLALSYEGVTFTHAKQVIESLFSIKNISARYEEVMHNTFIKGRCASILQGTSELGIIGEVHPDVLHNMNIHNPVVIVEVYL